MCLLVGRLAVGGHSCYSLSLVVTGIVQILALQVPPGIVDARDLHPVFVHTPTDAALTAAGWLTLHERMRKVCETTSQTGMYCEIEDNILWVFCV